MRQVQRVADRGRGGRPDHRGTGRRRPHCCGRPRPGRRRRRRHPRRGGRGGLHPGPGQRERPDRRTGRDLVCRPRRSRGRREGRRVRAAPAARAGPGADDGLLPGPGRGPCGGARRRLPPDRHGHRRQREHRRRRRDAQRARGPAARREWRRAARWRWGARAARPDRPGRHTSGAVTDRGDPGLRRDQPAPRAQRRADRLRPAEGRLPRAGARAGGVPTALRPGRPGRDRAGRLAAPGCRCRRWGRVCRPGAARRPDATRDRGGPGDVSLRRARHRRRAGHHRRGLAGPADLARQDTRRRGRGGRGRGGPGRCGLRARAAHRGRGRGHRDRAGVRPDRPRARPRRVHARRRAAAGAAERPGGRGLARQRAPYAGDASSSVSA